jgi:hypothetical protein
MRCNDHKFTVDVLPVECCASVVTRTGTGVAFAGRQGEHTGLIYIAAMAAHNVPEGATISMVRTCACPRSHLFAA